MYFRKCENMTKMILKRYFNESYQLEIWGMSTKHPDFTYIHKKYVETEYDKCYWDFASIDDNFIQWVSWIASHQLFQQQAIKILKAGFQIYSEFPEDGNPSMSDILETHIIEWEDGNVYGIERKD